MSELDYYKLPQFIERVSNGLEGPQKPLRIATICGNQTHNISFLDHCDELCKKHNTDRLRLLSVIQQKLNGDMIVRLNESPVFNDKVKHVLSEWGENIEPIELFRCPNNCYDCSDFNDLRQVYQRNNDTLESLNLNADNLESDIYNSVESLRNEFHTCEDILRNNLSQIETRQYEYEPKYRAILCDLSTKQKPFYLDGLMNSEDQTNMIQHVNRKVNRHIPENINSIFLNIVLIPTLIAKEMERLKNESIHIKNEIQQRQKILSDIMERIGPNEPLSVGFLKMLSDLTSIFDSVSDEELPDDDEDDSEKKVEKAMENIVVKELDESENTSNNSNIPNLSDKMPQEQDQMSKDQMPQDQMPQEQMPQEQMSQDQMSQEQDQMYYLDMKRNSRPMPDNSTSEISDSLYDENVKGYADSDISFF